MRIELQNVSKKFKSVQALNDVSLVINPGQIVALLGANGAGKTTLLRCLAGIVGTDEGRVLFDDELFARKRLDLRRHFMFLPDFPAVFEEWSAIRHIGMALRLYEVAADDLENRTIELLREFDLLPLANVPVATLSRGQRYKASLAALLAVNPEVWLLDEPFASGMDPHGINVFKRRARAAAAKGQTIIYTTQILDAAERFSDRVCVLHRGKIWAFGATAELRIEKDADVTVLDELFKMLREEESR